MYANPLSTLATAAVISGTTYWLAGERRSAVATIPNGAVSNHRLVSTHGGH